MIYEYRVYDAAPGRIQDLHARFRDHTIRIFERNGIKSVAYFISVIGGSSDQLTYILEFENLAHREKAWASFVNDPEWQKVKAESEKDGPIILRFTNKIFAPTDYSNLK